MKFPAYFPSFSERHCAVPVGGGFTRRIRAVAVAAIFLWVSGAAQAAAIDLGLTQCLVAPDPAARGAAITYTLNYANNSFNNDATSPSITIPLPATTTYVAGSASASCVHDGLTPGTLTCTPASIPANSSGSVSFQLKTTGTTGVTISTSAAIAVAGGDTDSNAGNDTASCTATINNGVDLSATVGATASSVPGGSTITWTVNGSNAGPDQATNQVFTTTLPSTLSYVASGSGGNGWSCSATGQVVTCTRSTSLASGASYPQLPIVTQLSAGVSSGSVTLAGTISSAVGEVNTADNTSNYSVTVTAGADLSVNLPALSMTAPNTAINYTLTVANNGPSDATDGITVTFQLPAGFTTGGSVTPTGAGWNACTWSGQVATCVFPGNFVSGRTETITVASTTPTVSVPTTYNAATDNKATIAGVGGGGGNGPADPVSGNNQVNRSIQVTPSNAVYLDLKKTKSPNPVAVGSNITSVIRVANGVIAGDGTISSGGPYAAAANTVTLYDDLEDAKEQYVSTSGNWNCATLANTPSAGWTRVSCTNTTAIAVNGSSSLTVITKALVNGVLTNTATVSHPGNWNTSLVPIGASVTATPATNSPNLKITKSGTTASNTMSGGRLELKNTESTLTYSLVVTNQGDGSGGAIDATDIVITDVIPGYRTNAPTTSYGAITAVLTNTSGSSTAAFTCGTSSDTVTCTQTGSTVLKKGDYVTVTIPVSRSLNDGNFTNTATAYSTTQGDPDRSDNSASFNIQIDPIADLEMVSKTVSPASAKAGTDVTYVLTFKNDGPSTSSGVEVKDVFTLGAADPGFTFISASLSGVTGGGSCSGLTAGTNYNSAGTPTLTCSGFSLTNSQQGTVTIIVRPNWKAGTQGAATLSNSARIYSTTTAEDLSAAVGDPGDSVSRATAVNFKTQTLTVTNAGLDVGIATNDAAPGGPDPLGYDPTNGGDNTSNDIAYLVRVNNYGPSLATGVRFTYKMTPPSGKVVKFMGDTTSVGGSYAGAICDNIGSTVTGPASLTVTCTYPTTGNADQLASGTNETRYLVFRALTAPDAAGYTVSTLVTVAANETDSNPANDTATESTTIKVRADLSLTKTADRTLVNTNDNVVFTITVTNSGPGNDTGVVVKDLLPSGLQFVSATATRGSYVNGTGIWTIGALNNGENVVLTLTAKVTAASGSVVNTAEVTAADLPDPDSTPNNHVASEDDQASATVTVTAATLGSISGKVFLDKDNNGTFGGSDSALSGVTVNLTGYSFGANGNDDNGAGDDQAVTATATTDGSGNYSFPGLLAGKYTVTEPSQPANTGNGITTAGSNGGSTTGTGTLPSAISGIVINASPGYTATGYDFAEVDGNLQGYVYVDANNNGAKDAGESPIAGVTIKLSGYNFGANGSDDNGGGDDQAVTATTTTNAAGLFTFPIQPGVYTLEEIQDSVLLNSYTDGKETAGVVGGTVVNTAFGNNPGYNKIQNITVTAAGLSANSGTLGGYLFGEHAAASSSLIPPVVSGYVYVDSNHDRVRPVAVPDSRVTGWTVTLTATRSNGSSEVICAVKTDSTGYYHLDNLSCLQDYPQWSNGLPTSGVTYQTFSLSFSNPGEGGVTTSPQSGGDAGVVNAATGRIQAISLNPGDNIVEQNLPLDPSGVVYDAVTRAPVSGAVVTLLEGGIPVPAACLVSNTNPVTTGTNGYYEFLLQLGGACSLSAGAHTFTIEVTPPANYAPGVSTMIPPTAASYKPTNGGVDAIQVQATAPSGAQSTRYYLTLMLTLGNTPATSSSNVVNNHIPLDPVKAGLIYVAKTSPLLNVSRGDLVPYTVTAINSQAMPLANIAVVDHIPPGFRYRTGSATLNGAPSEPTVSGRDLVWNHQSFNANEKKVWKLILVVGSGVGDGEYVNQAWALNALTGGLDSNVAGATVRVIPDPNFDCSDIIGKVFDDKNANGYQDQGEPGIANVRLATPRGLLVTSDGEGRFHITCADIPQQDRGSNFVMKLDERTLPSGYRLTTDNPGDVRVTRGKMAKLNFGATVHKVVRLELSAAAFAADGTALLPEWEGQLAALPSRLADRPSVLRIAYARADAGDGLGAARLDAVAARVRELWSALKDDDDPGRKRYPLVIETELEGGK